MELSRSGVDSVCYGNPSIRVRVDESCRYRCPSWPTGTKAASSSGHRFLIEIYESRKATGIGIIGELGSSVVGRTGGRYFRVDGGWERKGKLIQRAAVGCNGEAEGNEAGW